MSTFKKLAARASNLIKIQKTKDEFGSSNSLHQVIPETSCPLTKPLYHRAVQSFVLIWLDQSIDELHNDDYKYAFNYFRQVTNDISTFTDIEKCVSFIINRKGEQIFLIASGKLGQIIAPRIHDLDQVDSIYIFCGDKDRHEPWTRKYRKINQNVFTDPESLHKKLSQITETCHQDILSISIIAANAHQHQAPDFNQIELRFLTMQILKEILLTTDFTKEHVKRFIDYCHAQFVENTRESEVIKIFETDYYIKKVIEWYTCDSFLYSMLTRAIYNMNFDVLFHMGFFIRDLFDSIACLHTEQDSDDSARAQLLAYRAHRLPKSMFAQLENMQGALLSFNGFLSASKKPQLDLSANSLLPKNNDLVNILFEIKVNTSKPSTFYANIREHSSSKAPDEVLFAMNSVFRIGNIVQHSGSSHKIELVLITDEDEQLPMLIETIHKNTLSYKNGWHRLGDSLIKRNALDKAEQIYQVLLSEITDYHQKALIYCNLGSIKYDQGKYREAIEWYKQSIESDLKVFYPTDPNLISSYCGIGLAYSIMNEYSNALSYYEKAHAIAERLPKTDSRLATSHNNIGSVYWKLGQYSQARSYYEEAVRCGQYSNHPNLPVFRQNLEFIKKKL